jgi:hypothetical protein
MLSVIYAKYCKIGPYAERRYGECRDREVLLLERLDSYQHQYSLPPCTNKFRSAPSYIENIFFIKQPTLMRRSTVLSLPPQLVFLGRGVI